MVKIPELAKDGQNWKIYHAKFLEVAATFDCLEVLAGRPYKGDDWDGCNALLCCMFMETEAPSIYFKIRRRTVYKNFKYLAKRFCDNEPIPHANEFQCAGTATAAETPENYPMSTNAATEQLANANSDEDDLSTTKALTQGTKSVDNGIVRRQDPRTSLEASAQGTSAKCIETTAVVLESTPHKSQTELQNSLPLTPRLPIEGKPSGYKQEAVESVVTAGHTKGTAQSANPPETDANTDRTTLLGGELAEMACGVNEGDRMECESKSRLQQMKLLCKEIIQHSEIANKNVPIAHGVPLEGEWTWCASSEATNLKGNANVFNTAIEHADGSDESTKTTNTKDIESEGCEGSMDERASVDKVDGDASHGTGPADMSNELMEFVAVSIEPEDLGSGGIPCVCLGN